MVSSAPRAIAYSRQVDANALKTNQIAIGAVTSLAFVLGSDFGVWLILALAVSLAIGAIRPGYGPIQVFYRHGLLASGLVKPSPSPSDPAPHRFAQAMGAAVLAVAAILLLTGVTTLGWILAWVVVALALANLLFGFCAGCFIFLQLRKAGVGA
jgi:Domain of unknown function (DUF4395)